MLVASLGRNESITGPHRQLQRFRDSHYHFGLGLADKKVLAGSDAGGDRLGLPASLDATVVHPTQIGEPNRLRHGARQDRFATADETLDAVGDCLAAAAHPLQNKAPIRQPTIAGAIREPVATPADEERLVAQPAAVPAYQLRRAAIEPCHFEIG